MTFLNEVTKPEPRDSKPEGAKVFTGFSRRRQRRYK